MILIFWKKFCDYQRRQIRYHKWVETNVSGFNHFVRSNLPEPDSNTHTYTPHWTDIPLNYMKSRMGSAESWHSVKSWGCLNCHFCAFEFMAIYFYCVLLASFLFHLSLCSCFLHLWNFKRQITHAFAHFFTSSFQAFTELCIGLAVPFLYHLSSVFWILP